LPPVALEEVQGDARQRSHPTQRSRHHVDGGRRSLDQVGGTESSEKAIQVGKQIAREARIGGRARVRQRAQAARVGVWENQRESALKIGHPGIFRNKVV
jgi:hypothetical protein